MLDTFCGMKHWRARASRSWLTASAASASSSAATSGLTAAPIFAYAHTMLLRPCARSAPPADLYIYVTSSCFLHLCPR